MLISCHFQILLAISEVQLTLHKVHTVHTVKSAVSLKWQVGFENDIKITPIFTINFSSKMIINMSLCNIKMAILKHSEQDRLETISLTLCITK